MTIPSDLYHDLDAPWIYAHYDEEKRQKAAAHEGIRYLVRMAYEDNRQDHRTGCVTSILRTVSEVLIKERGWTSRQAAEAMVMEGVRAGGELERKRRELK